MSARMSTIHVDKKSETRAGILRRLVQVGVMALLQGSVLFISSGRLDWAMAWLFLAVYAGTILVNSAVLLRTDPELIAERGQVKEDVKSWDRSLALIVSVLGPLATLLVAGLDARFGWSPQLPLGVHLAALVVVAVGYLAWGWAMASNKFFSGFVRIQKERGHTVASGGPYRFVRHPGYAAMVVFTLATPVLLGSLWALVPAVLTVAVLVVRTSLEDRTLQAELDGYREYAQRVRYRLVPGVW